jgi:hypothetical protein
MANAHVFLAQNHVGTGEIEKATIAFKAARRLAPEFVQAILNGHSV